MTSEIAMPRMIQRIKCRPQTDNRLKSLGAAFAMDYMGASEFEWGALPRALKELRSSKLVGPLPISSSTGQIIHFVGPEAMIVPATSLFENELRERKTSWTLEPSFIYETYTGKSVYERAVPSDKRFDAWWCIDHGRGFVLFKERQNADVWLKCLNKVVPLRFVR